MGSAQRSRGLVATGFSGLGGWRMAMVAVGGVCLVTAVFAWMWLRELPSAAGDAAGRPGESASKPNALLILSPRYLAGTLMLWLLFISMLTISYCLNSWLPTLLVEVGRSERFAAMSVSVFSLGGIIAALGVGVLIDRLGRDAHAHFVPDDVDRAAIRHRTGARIRLRRSADGPSRRVRILHPRRLRRHQRRARELLPGLSASGRHRLDQERRAHRHAGGTRADRRGADRRMAETTIMSLFAVPAALSVVSLIAISMSGRREG